MSSNTYGYIADTGPTQAYGSNNGVFDPADINDLIAENKWSGVGTLELIQTQSGSGVGQIDFTAIKQTEYNVHLLTITDFQIGTDGQPMGLRFSNGSFISSGYQWGLQVGQADGTTDEARSTSSTYLRLNAFNGDQTNERANGYVYLYNLGDSTKYSFYTSQVSATLEYSTRYGFEFGSGVHPTAETISGIRLTSTSGNISASSVSLYGIKAYS